LFLGSDGCLLCDVQKYLSEKAAAAVQALLPESAGGELSTMCPWADTVRWHYHWASPLHYVDTPQVCNFKYSRMSPPSLLFDPSPPSCSPTQQSVALVKPWGFNCPPLNELINVATCKPIHEPKASVVQSVWVAMLASFTQSSGATEKEKDIHARIIYSGNRKCILSFKRDKMHYINIPSISNYKSF